MHLDLGLQKVGGGAEQLIVPAPFIARFAHICPDNRLLIFMMRVRRAVAENPPLWDARRTPRPYMYVLFLFHLHKSVPR